MSSSSASESTELSKKVREARRKQIKKEFEKTGWSSAVSGEKSGCNWSFVFDPSGRLVYYWSMIVSLAFIYNSWVIVYRFAFKEISSETVALWLSLDGIADFIYVLDVVVHFRIGYLEEGVLQTQASKLRQHYMNSTIFYIDCLCLLPLDFLYLSIGFNSMLRCFRLIKIYRFWSFLDRNLSLGLAVIVTFGISCEQVAIQVAIGVRSEAHLHEDEEEDNQCAPSATYQMLIASSAHALRSKSPDSAGAMANRKRTVESMATRLKFGQDGGNQSFLQLLAPPAVFLYLLVIASRKCL